MEQTKKLKAIERIKHLKSFKAFEHQCLPLHELCSFFHRKSMYDNITFFKAIKGLLKFSQKLDFTCF